MDQLRSEPPSFEPTELLEAQGQGQGFQSLQAQQMADTSNYMDENGELNESGKKSRKRKKRFVHPDLTSVQMAELPKKPPSAYKLFLDDSRDDAAWSHGSRKKSEAWTQLSQSEKQVYIERSRIEQAEYEAALADKGMCADQVRQHYRLVAADKKRKKSEAASGELGSADPEGQEGLEGDEDDGGRNEQGGGEDEPYFQNIYMDTSIFDEVQADGAGSAVDATVTDAAVEREGPSRAITTQTTTTSQSTPAPNPTTPVQKPTPTKEQALPTIIPLTASASPPMKEVKTKHHKVEATPPSPFALFVEANRDELVKRGDSQIAINKHFEKKWSQMTSEDQKPFQDQANQFKEGRSKKKKPAKKFQRLPLPAIPNKTALELQPSRVKRLMEMDPDVKNVTKEATRLVSKAAEIFVHWFAQRVYRNAEEEGKRAVAVNHFRKAQLDPCGELFFLKIWEMMEEEEVLMPMPLQPKPAPAASTGECPNGCQRKAEASPTSPKLEGTQGPTQEVPVSPSSSSSSSPSLSSVSSPSLSLASIDMDDKDSAEQTNAKTEEDDPVKCMMASVYYDTSDGEIQVVEEEIEVAELELHE